MFIRYYHPEDDPALMELERLCPRGLQEPFVHYRRRFIDRAMIFSDHQLLVAEENSVIIGTGAVCVKRTQIGGCPVSLGYIFDIRTHPAVRRRGIGQALVEAMEDYLLERDIDGAYGHIVASNVGSLRLFEKLGYQRLRQLLYLTFQPFPMLDFPDWMPRHYDDHVAEHDLIDAVHSSRDLYVPDVAERVKNFGFQRWSVDMGAARFAGMSLFDQSHVFQQWPAHLPFPTEEEMQTRGNKTYRLFDEVGIHTPQLLQSVFDTLRDVAVAENVNKLTMILDRMDRVPTFLFSEAYQQLDYWMVFRSLKSGWTPEWQDGPIYVDAREL